MTLGFFRGLAKVALAEVGGEADVGGGASPGTREMSPLRWSASTI